jgi:adenylosuccinate synthase
VPASSVIGLQWGDEAKGKLVDLLAPKHDIVVRYQGGANAGHTVVSGDEVYKLHHIPSGILHSSVTNIIAPGVVIEPSTMIAELDGLEKRGIHPSKNLMLSDRAHVVMPWHIVEDHIMNAHKVQGEAIGTTLRGIGPCYRDKVGRTMAFRVTDLLSDSLGDRITEIVASKREMLGSMASAEQMALLSADAIFKTAQGWAKRLRPIAANTTDFLLDALDDGKELLMEGAQGALLDIDHGTYPFVTSSNSSGVGISSGSGVPGKWIRRVLGVAKAYSTRVGGGPFPTELDCDVGQKIRDIGHEYGTTTGRPRRCGWFDAVAVRYTSRLSGITSLALMMMDVLGHFEEIQICIAYELDGKRIDTMPSNAEDLRRCKPIYESMPGWNTDVTGVRKVSDMPAAAIDYAKRIESIVGVPVDILSVGPDRVQTLTTQSDTTELAFS